ncbi:MAG TPA: alpha/beta hydrolase [Stellaceae bacterium]
MRLISLLFAASIILSGCAANPAISLDVDEQVWPSSATALAGIAANPLPSARANAATLTDKRFVTSDGTALPLCAWVPDEAPRAVVLALHGFNDYSNAFAVPGPAFARHGILTYAYDQRGFGAGPNHGRWAGQDKMVGDAVEAARLLRRRHPDLPLYVMGESMGGAVAILAASGTATTAPADVDGVILVAPAVWGRQTMNMFERAGLWLADLMPSLHVSGSDLPITVMPSDNLPMLRAFNADPFVIKETRADAVAGLVDLMSSALDAAPRFAAPALILYGERDEIVPRPPVARMVANLPRSAGTRQRVAFYPRGYHMLMRDLSGDVVIDDAIAWIENHKASLPSGLDRGARTTLAGGGSSAGPRFAAAELP